jgi:hypothetical protein
MQRSAAMSTFVVPDVRPAQPVESDDGSLVALPEFDKEPLTGT